MFKYCKMVFKPQNKSEQLFYFICGHKYNIIEGQFLQQKI